MGNIVTELYVEIYWRLFRIFKNENIAAAIDLILLTVFQVFNIYALTVIGQKFLSVDVISYFLHKPLFVLIFCSVLFILNFFVGKGAKKIIRKDEIETYISRRFVTYAILTIILLVISHYVGKS